MKWAVILAAVLATPGMSTQAASPEGRNALASQPSLHGIFGAFDANGNGFASAAELGAPSRTLLSFDADGNGGLSFDEFARAVTQHWDRPRLGSGLLSEHYVWLMTQAGADLGRALDIGRAGLDAVGPDFRLHLHVGWLALRMGDLELATSCATVASEVDPGAGDTGCLFAAIQLAGQNTDSAVEILERSLELPSYSTCGHLSLARLKSSMGAPEAARDVLQSALATGQASPEDEIAVRLLLAELEERLGRPAEAGIHALQALSLDPRHMGAWSAAVRALDPAVHGNLASDIQRRTRARAPGGTGVGP